MRKLIDEIDDEFLAKLFVYSRERAYMDHMPAALFVVLVTRDTKLLMHQVFVRVRDNGRVLRTVFRMTRSGQFGRKRRERG